MMNDALRRYLSETDHPITEKTLRQVLRQEIPEYLRGLTAGSTRTRAKRGARRWFGTPSSGGILGVSSTRCFMKSSI